MKEIAENLQKQLDESYRVIGRSAILSPNESPRVSPESLRALKDQIKINHPNPRVSPESLRVLQLDLLRRVESELGRRDLSREICQPRFFGDDPHIWFDPTQTGIVLSRKAECDWPKAVFEMAHETIHLLNPVRRKDSNYLEEGIAVAFSLNVQHSYCINVEISKEAPYQKYHNALRLIKELPGGPLKAGLLIRERVGKLSAAETQDLEVLFQSVDKNDLCKMAKKFPF